MKIHSYFSVVSLVILLCFVACKESTVTTPTEPEEEIRLEDYIYKVDSVQQICTELYGNPFHHPRGYNIISVSKNKDLAFIVDSDGQFMTLDNGPTRFFGFDFTSLRSQDTFRYFNYRDAVFSPYDNDLILAYITTTSRIGNTSQTSSDWYYYKISTKQFTLLNLQTTNLEYYRNSPRLIRWLPTSSPGNDHFYWENNTILSYPSGLISSNPSGFTIKDQERVLSVSPDMKKIFTVFNQELYLNGTKVPNTVMLLWDYMPISWSDDSKYFFGLCLPENPLAHMNIIYKMQNGSNTNFSIHRIIDITRKHCSDQHPVGFGYNHYTNAMFLTDSTYAMCLFEQHKSSGELVELNFKGDIKRKFNTP